MRGVVAVIVVVLLTSLSEAQEFQTIQPKTYRSPGGEFELRVDPGTHYGQGEGSYRLTRRGEIVWKAKLPYTFWVAAVADDGTTAGVAYTYGCDGFPIGGRKRSGDNEYGEFVTAVLNADGTVRATHTEKRIHSLVIHARPDPLCQGVFIHPQLDRFIARISRWKNGRPDYSWRLYALSTGKMLKEISPANMAPPAGEFSRVENAVPVRGTPLTLVQWRVYDQNKPGAVYSLVDPEFDPVWTLERRGDFQQPDRQAQHQLENLSSRIGIRSDEAGKFSVLFASERQLVTFSVRDDAGRWRFDEITREAASDPTTRPSTPPAVVLESLESFKLQTSEPVPIRNIADFDLDDKDRFGILRREDDGRYTVLLTNDAGDIQREIALKDFGGKQRWKQTITWLSGDTWLLIESGLAPKGKARGFKLDVNTGKQSEAIEYTFTDTESVTRDRAGGYVVLANQREDYTILDRLVAYNADGEERWSIGDGERDAGLSSPRSVAVMPDGKVALLTGIPGRLMVFDKSGVEVSTQKLDDILGLPAQYPTEIAADNDGGLILHDYPTTKPTYHVDASHKIRHNFLARHADGTKIELRKIRVDRRGRTWVNDDSMVCRLTDAGLADRVLGSAPTADDLGRIGDVTSGPDCTLYARSIRTGAIHVFSSSGKCLRVLTHAEAGGQIGRVLGVDATGTVLDGPLKKRYARMKPDGVVEFAALPQDGDGRQPTYRVLPGKDGAVWTGGFDTVQLFDPAGKLLKTIDRTADGYFLGQFQTMASAPDGSLAVMSGVEDGNLQAGVVSIFSATGEPIRAVRTPFGAFEIAYDGKRVASGAGKEILLVDVETGRQESFTPIVPAGDRDPYWRPALPPGLNELWLMNGNSESREVLRFRLPAGR